MFSAFLLPVLSQASIVQLTSPSQMTGPTTTLNDDIYADGTVANTLFQGQGVTPSRDDGFPVVIYDWAALGRTTTSPPNVIATIGIPWWTSLNFSFAGPVIELGMFFGNDQPNGFPQTTLYIYDKSNVLLGSVAVSTNNNTSVDQFIGLRSTVPFFSAQIVNDQTNWYAVVVDNVEFSTTTPEPSSLLLFSSLALALRRFTRARREQQHTV